VELGIRAMNTEQTQMFKQNIRLAYWCAYHYGHSVMPLLGDRIQAACIGLMRAVQHYDPARAQLSTYATRLMYREIRHTSLEERRPPKGDPVVIACSDVFGAVYAEDLIGMLPSQEPSPEDKLLRQEERTLLFEAARRVPRRNKCKSTWTAVDVIQKLDQGMTQLKIAQELGVSRARIGQVVADVRTEYQMMGGEK